MDSFSDETLADPVELTRQLVDIESVSGNEARITDVVAATLRRAPHLRVERDGNVVSARHDAGAGRRVVLAGHLDTVPIADNLPARIVAGIMHGCGTSDMKSGCALALHLAATLDQPRYDLTYLFYDCEEIEAERNGLNRIARTRPDWLAADFAVLLEPTYGQAEAGCQGTMRAQVTCTGQRAHAARSWHGVNAIHAAAEVLNRLHDYSARQVTLDGCRYREGLNAVRIAGGVAGNVVPDECTVEVNFRFAPDRSVADAEAHLRQVFDGLPLTITDAAPAAPPGLTDPAAAEFVAAVGTAPRAKLGWTDVARFAELGVPALNFGPGDPNLAHQRDERVELDMIRSGAATLRAWLSR